MKTLILLNRLQIKVLYNKLFSLQEYSKKEKKSIKIFIRTNFTKFSIISLSNNTNNFNIFLFMNILQIIKIEKTFIIQYLELLKKISNSKIKKLQKNLNYRDNLDLQEAQKRFLQTLQTF